MAISEAQSDGQVPETRVFLQPIAAPSVLGYFGLASGLIMFGTWLAGGWGSATSYTGFFEFILFFAGIGQLAAGLWSYKARDAVAASIHGAWGAFFTGFGIYWLAATLGAVNAPPPGAADQPVGQWFIYMAVITWTTAFAVLARSATLFFTHAVLGAGAVIAAVSLITGSAGWQHGAGWVFVAAGGVRDLPRCRADDQQHVRVHPASPPHLAGRGEHPWQAAAPAHGGRRGRAGRACGAVRGESAMSAISEHETHRAETAGGIRARVYLQPIAPPVTLGLWGFFGSTMVLSTWMLHWWGTPLSPGSFFAFNAAFGGLAQFLAGLWSFKARDYIASSLLTMWGGFWMAWGLAQGLGAAHAVTIPPPTTPNPGLAVWFIPLALFTLAGAMAALSPKSGNIPLFVLLGTVGAGSACVCGGFWTGSTTWQDIAAWLFIVGACAAWYVGAMTMLHDAWRRVILPLGKFSRTANIPGRMSLYPAEYVYGQPGVRQGQ